MSSVIKTVTSLGTMTTHGFLNGLQCIFTNINPKNGIKNIQSGTINFPGHLIQRIPKITQLKSTKGVQHLMRKIRRRRHTTLTAINRLARHTHHQTRLIYFRRRGHTNRRMPKKILRYIYPRLFLRLVYRNGGAILIFRTNRNGRRNTNNPNKVTLHLGSTTEVINNDAMADTHRTRLQSNLRHIGPTGGHQLTRNGIYYNSAINRGVVNPMIQNLRIRPERTLLRMINHAHLRLRRIARTNVSKHIHRSSNRRLNIRSVHVSTSSLRRLIARIIRRTITHLLGLLITTRILSTAGLIRRVAVGTNVKRRHLNVLNLHVLIEIYTSIIVSGLTYYVNRFKIQHRVNTLRVNKSMSTQVR